MNTGMFRCKRACARRIEVATLAGLRCSLLLPARRRSTQGRRFLPGARRATTRRGRARGLLLTPATREPCGALLRALRLRALTEERSLLGCDGALRLLKSMSFQLKYGTNAETCNYVGAGTHI